MFARDPACDPKGGGDKGLADLAGTPMLAHVIQRFAPQVSRLVLNANGDPARFAAFGLEIVADRDSGDQGPLAGLDAVMHWAEQHGGDRVIATVSTDTPFLPLDLVARLAAAQTDPGRPVIASSGERLHATIGLWPLWLKAEIAAALAEGRRSVEAFAKAHGAIAVPFPFSDIGGRTVDPFFNANTPDDLAAARALLAGPT
jgi:molybdenum cofactor guanylyltransferase